MTNEYIDNSRKDIREGVASTTQALGVRAEDLQDASVEHVWRLLQQATMSIEHCPFSHPLLTDAQVYIQQAAMALPGKRRGVTS